MCLVYIAVDSFLSECDYIVQLTAWSSEDIVYKHCGEGPVVMKFAGYNELIPQSFNSSNI